MGGKSKRNRKNLKMRCCVIPCGQTDAGSSQKHYFLAFRIQSNLNYSDSLGLDKIVWIIEGLDNREYEY